MQQGFALTELQRLQNSAIVIMSISLYTLHLYMPLALSSPRYWNIGWAITLMWVQVAQDVAFDVVEALMNLQSQRAGVPTSVLFPFFPARPQRPRLSTAKVAVPA